MKKKILVTYKFPEEWLQLLHENFEVIWPHMKHISDLEFIQLAHEVDGILALFGVPVPEEVFENNERLKIISNFGVGVDHIPVDEATRSGILVTNTPSAVTEATAELSLGLMLACSRRIAECDRKIRKKEIVWGVNENLGTTLVGKTLGIVGMGKIGKAFASRAKAMGMDVIYFSRNRLSKSESLRLNTHFVGLSELLVKSDVVSLHVPLTNETYHMITINELSLMKPTAILINTSRGSIVDEMALVSMLKGGLIASAGLDVYEKEPEIPEELLAMDQVVLMPHSGTATIETRMEIANVAIKNLLDFFNGHKPKYMVNPQCLT